MIPSPVYLPGDFEAIPNPLKPGEYIVKKTIKLQKNLSENYSIMSSYFMISER